MVRNGKLRNRFKLYVQEDAIPSIEEKPIKCLGNWFDSSVTDKNNITRTEKQSEPWLIRIEKSGLPGKCWMLALPTLTVTKTHMDVNSV